MTHILASRKEGRILVRFYTYKESDLVFVVCSADKMAIIQVNKNKDKGLLKK